MKLTIACAVISLYFFSCTAPEIRFIPGKSRSEEQLKKLLAEQPTYQFSGSSETQIKDTLSAVNLAESYIFEIYGRDNIISQRPYEAYFYQNCWVIEGSLPEYTTGGTFMIILDASNGGVVNITHGK